MSPRSGEPDQDRAENIVSSVSLGARVSGVAQNVVEPSLGGGLIKGRGEDASSLKGERLVVSKDSADMSRMSEVSGAGISGSGVVGMAGDELLSALPSVTCDYDLMYHFLEFCGEDKKYLLLAFDLKKNVRLSSVDADQKEIVFYPVDVQLSEFKKLMTGLLHAMGYDAWRVVLLSEHDVMPTTTLLTLEAYEKQNLQQKIDQISSTFMMNEFKKYFSNADVIAITPLKRR